MKLLDFAFRNSLLFVFLVALLVLLLGLIFLVPRTQWKIQGRWNRRPLVMIGLYIYGILALYGFFHSGTWMYWFVVPIAIAIQISPIVIIAVIVFKVMERRRAKTP